MNDTTGRDALPTTTLVRLGPEDAARLEAHCHRLAPHDALNLFGAYAEPLVIKRYLAGIDFRHDVIVAALDREGAVNATVRIRAPRGTRWAELLPVREPGCIAAERWTELICAAVAAARSVSIGWLGVASLGYDPQTREALERAGFDLQAEEDGTIGELCLAQQGSA